MSLAEKGENITHWEAQGPLKVHFFNLKNRNKEMRRHGHQSFDVIKLTWIFYCHYSLHAPFPGWQQGNK
jgi:hypothetical protein